MEKNWNKLWSKSPNVKTVKQGIFMNINVSPANYILIDHHPFLWWRETFMKVVTSQLLFPLTNN